MKERYTVIGYYDDTGQAFVETMLGADAFEAMRIVAEQSDNPDTLCLIGAVKGHHTLQTPGEDNGSTAFACDLIESSCTECDGPNDDGEGYDGLCGNCADKKEEAAADPLMGEYDSYMDRMEAAQRIPLSFDEWKAGRHVQG